jgi:predicted exporter
VTGLTRLKIDDDLRHQQALSGDLQREKSEVHRLIGMGGGTEFVLVQAADSESALQTEEVLIQRLPQSYTCSRAGAFALERR